MTSNFSFGCYGNDSKHKKVPLSRNVCDGPRGASGRGEWMTCTQLMSHNYIQKENDANFSKET